MRATILFLTLLLCSFPRIASAEPTPPPAADAKSESEQFFQAGVSFQKSEDFEAAIAAYETSVQLFATKSALFNLANCQRAAHRYADAWYTLTRLQQTYGAELVEPMSSTSKAQLAELENLTGLMMVETQPSGATITLDDKPLGVTPWANSVRVAIGQHTLRATLAGYSDQTKSIQLTPKQTANVRLELILAPQPVAAPSPTATEPAPAPPAARGELYVSPSLETSGPSSAWRTVGWVSAALGGVAVALGTHTGLRALDVDERLSTACEAGHCAPSADPQIARLDRLTLSTNIFFGAGAALLATGATLILWPATPEQPETVTLTLRPNAVSLGGSF